VEWQLQRGQESGFGRDNGWEATMTVSATGVRAGTVHMLKSSYNAQDMAQMRDAIDAVCGELGIARNSTAQREIVAKRVMAAYARGRRQPLNLVHAGLGDFHA
jgi:hypothetical protein